MKILVLNYEYPPIGGGAAPVTQQLCRQLAQRVQRLDVVTMRFGQLPTYQQDQAVHVHRVPCWRRRANICQTHEMATYLLPALLKARRLHREHRYNILHTHFLIPTGPVAYILHKLTGLPYIITSHGSDVPGFNTDRFTFLHHFTRPFLRCIAARAAAVVSPSLYLRDLIQQNIAPLPVEHIPNGICLQQFHLNHDRPKENIILATGRLLPRKGFHTLIKAVHDIALPYEVHIAGDGPYRDALMQLAKDSKTPVVFHGWLESHSPALHDLYERAAIYVLPSEKENASVSLLEAMAARCAVITSNVSGCPETVGDAGLLIDFDDHQRLGSLLQQLAAQPDEITRMGQNAYQRLVDYFLWPRIVDRYMQLFVKYRKTQS